MFERGAELVRARHIESDGDLGSLIDPNEPFDGDPELRHRLKHMYDAGAWVLLESAIADLPADLRWLFEAGAVTIPQLAALHRSLGATTAADLARATARQLIRGVAGLDESVEAAIASALPGLRRTIPRIPLGRATAIVEPVIERLEARPEIEWAAPVGSLRRGQDTVGDLEIVAATSDAGDAIEDLARMSEVVRVLHRSQRQLILLLDRVQLAVRFGEPPRAGTMLFELTGSRPHLEQLATRAAELNVSLDAPAFVEEEIYARVGLPLIPPEIRNGDEEVSAAIEGRLPTLVSVADIQGDLHMHSTWSDGRDSIEAMVDACCTLGYRYLAITDHSPHSAASRNLAVDDVARQGEEIAKVRSRHPTVDILHGCEADILPNGRLDFSDRVLERFDIVLASLHDGAGQPPDQLLKRYLAAMRHPMVSVITHPTNRMVPYRRGYDLDYDRLFEAAAETGTAVEIDGAPAHLDLNGELARTAIAAGATVVIDSDCHRSDMLGRQMRLGVLTARRGWVEARHVLNARPLAEVRAFIARKRAR